MKPPTEEAEPVAMKEPAMDTTTKEVPKAEFDATEASSGASAPGGTNVRVVTRTPPLERKPDFSRQLGFQEFTGEYEIPPLSLLDAHVDSDMGVDDAVLVSTSEILREKLNHFDIVGKVVEVSPGPIVTMYEFEPDPDVRVTKIANMDKDLALALKSSSIRIVAPLPGRGTVGIEVPNRRRETVYLRDILESEKYRKSAGRIPIALGTDIFGNPQVTDLTEMPHLLVAGTTGSGKSVFLNTVVMSIIFRHSPETIRLLLVDPKRLEFQGYDGIPNLLLPVVTNPNDASKLLRRAVDEMEKRYSLMSDMGVRDLDAYNARVEKNNENPEMKRVYSSDDEGNEIVTEDPVLMQKLPYIVIIIDEFADLMMASPKEVLESVQRLAQMARAAGIHLILATQRPSKDVITGDIKANMAARITFKLFSKTDSRVILDQNGAEALLGKGDMLFLPSKGPELIRMHGAFVSDNEVKRVVRYVKKFGGPPPVETLFSEPLSEGDAAGRSDPFFDEKYEDAKRLVKESERATISYVQRILKIGYNRAAKIIEQMEMEGYVSPPDHTGKREIYHERFEDGKS